MLNKPLLLGIAFALPFFILNALVASGAPVAEVFRSEVYPGGSEQILILGLLLLVGIGGIISLYPVIRHRRLMILNILVGVLLIGFSSMAGYGLGVDVYHCDILQIPNCD